MKKLFYLMVVIAVLGLIVSGCSIPLKSVVPTSEKGNPKPELGAPTLEKITFIHYAKSSNRSKPVWDDSADKYKLLLGGLKWEDIMQYEVNSDGSKLDDDDVMVALGASLDTWDTAITGNFELFDDLIVLTDTELNPGDLDYRNIVVWEDLSEIYGANVIAVNSFWFDPALKVIVDSDVVFNAYYTWSTDEFCDEEAMDLQNIATHEFGHNGLNDLYMSPCTALTMYGYGDFGDIEKRTLGTGDISGIQELYGE